MEEAKELEALVEKGLVDGMKPKQVRAEYPQFNIFTYRAFSGGLTNIRKKHNKEAANVKAHDGSGGICTFSSFCRLSLFFHLTCC